MLKDEHHGEELVLERGSSSRGPPFRGHPIVSIVPCSFSVQPFSPTEDPNRSGTEDLKDHNREDQRVSTGDNQRTSAGDNQGTSNGENQMITTGKTRELQPGTNRESEPGVPEDLSHGGIQDHIQGRLENLNRGGPEAHNRGRPEDLNRGRPEDLSRGRPEDLSRGGSEDHSRGGLQGIRKRHRHWTYEEITSLIELWKNESVLYDMKHPHYHNKDIKNNSISLITDKLADESIFVTCEEVCMYLCLKLGFLCI